MNKYPFYKSVQYNVGCPYSCDFCFEGKIYSPKSNLCTLDDFTKSISYGEKIVIEDSVLMSYQNFDDIMTNIGAKNVRFAAYARISEIIKNPDKVKRMKEAGCEALIIGIETLDSSMLKLHNKEIVSYQTRLGLDILKNNDMKVQGCFMLGFPKILWKIWRELLDLRLTKNLMVIGGIFISRIIVTLESCYGLMVEKLMSMNTLMFS